MEMNFEEFEHGPVVKASERMHASICRRGTLFLNRRVIEAIGEPDYVVLMYDRRHSVIGVAPATSSRPNAFRLKPKERKRSAARVLYASNFCRFYGISPDTTLAFTAPEVNKDGVLILDLNEVRPIKRI